MKRLSDRGIETIMVIAFLIASIIAIVVVNNMQEKQIQEWQKEQGIKIEVVENE